MTETDDKAKIQDCTFVIFGATGNLAVTKLLPALYQLDAEGLLPRGVKILGVGRRIADRDAWLAELEKGLARVILGTVAVRDPALVKQAAAEFPGKVAVGIDAKGGKVAVEGWAETSELTVIDMARQFEDAGVAAIIYTDIDRDGILTGINWPSTLELARAVSIPVIASGGLASMDDIAEMTKPEYALLEGSSKEGARCRALLYRFLYGSRF